jgi:hypothetical protein
MIEIGTAAIKSNEEAFRETAESGIAHAKGTYEKAIVAGERATDLFKGLCRAGTALEYHQVPRCGARLRHRYRATPRDEWARSSDFGQEP